MPTASERRARQAEADGRPTDEHAFDADQRASKREKSPVTIGGQVFHRRRKNWGVTRSLRDLMRVQERSNTKQAQLRRKLEDDELSSDAVDAIQDEMDQLRDEADEGAYQIIALLLANDEGGSPGVEHLKDTLDVEDAGDLAQVLAGGGEPDPTPTTESSSTS